MADDPTPPAAAQIVEIVARSYARFAWGDDVDWKAFTRAGEAAISALTAAGLSVVASAEADGVIAEIAAERRRPIEVEGWTPGHDNEHDDGEMAMAAACYAGFGARYPNRPPEFLWSTVLRFLWPWSEDWWKPKNRRRDLIRAGALIVAEIDRLDRERPLPPPPEGV